MEISWLQQIHIQRVIILLQSAAQLCTGFLPEVQVRIPGNFKFIWTNHLAITI